MVERIAVELRNEDPFQVTADALAVQYPQRLHGLMDQVLKQFRLAKRPVLLPAPGAMRLLDAVPGFAVSRVLIVGVTSLREYDYRDIRAFASRAIRFLSSISEVHHIALPVYGPGYRLDEEKSLESEVAGVLDAIRDIKVSDAVSKITLLERDSARAERIKALLPQLLVRGFTRGPATTDSNKGDLTAVAGPPPTALARAARLFLCYRREDAQDAAGRLYDRLVDVFGTDSVFMDIDSVPLGVDFVDHVAEQIARCSAVIVMIGKQWLTIKDKKRRRRLDNPDDLVRAEIAAALQQKIPVIPVIVQNASMPSADDLPENIRLLARRNGIQLRPEQWREGVERLLKELNPLLTPKQ
jgi:TIR domain